MTSIDAVPLAVRAALVSKRIARSPVFVHALLLLLMLDAILIGLHLALEMAQVFWGMPIPRSFRVTQDWSLGEIANYAKWMGVVAALAASWQVSRQAVHLAMLAVFALILADDMLQLHERGGHLLVKRLHLEAGLGLRAQDFGELLVWAVMGVASLVVLVLGFARSGAAARAEGAVLLALLALLLVFAVGLDMGSIAMDSLLPAEVWARNIVRALYLVEDAGEMVVASALCAAAVAITAARVRSAVSPSVRSEDSSSRDRPSPRRGAGGGER